jgi:hypothetical protein
MVTEYSWGLTWAGRAQKGIPLMLEAMRLNPHHPNWYLTSLADVYSPLDTMMIWSLYWRNGHRQHLTAGYIFRYVSSVPRPDLRPGGGR